MREKEEIMPKTIQRPYDDMDFIGFSFCGTHSSELKLYRVTRDMYTINLTNASNNNLVAIPEGDGSLYFGSNGSPIEFTIDVAFDKVYEEDWKNI